MFWMYLEYLTIEPKASVKHPASECQTRLFNNIKTKDLEERVASR